MSSYNRRHAAYATRRTQNWSRNQNVTRYASNVKLGPVAHTVLVALMITVLGLIYLTQATRATGYDYEIDRIDREINALAMQREDLEIENARLTSLETVQDSAVAQNMTAPASAAYARQ